MSEFEPAIARWLVSSDGASVLAAATGQLDDGVDELAVVQRLRREGYDAARTSAAVTAAVARRRARSRWPDADRLVFTRGSLEQASDPDVASTRARRFAGLSTWDLCAGVGGDALALGPEASALTAVEHDETRAILLEHNLGVRGLEARCVVGDALEVAVGDDGHVHTDPGRRREGRRVRRLREYVPSVPDLLHRHGSAPGIGIVMAPGVDLQDPDLPVEAELEFLQLGDQLVEAVAWTGTLRRPGVAATATLLPSGISRVRDDRGSAPRLRVRDVGAVLVEVVPAAVRARVHDDLGDEIGAGRVSTRRALLTLDEMPPASPWYRARPVLAVLPARPRAVRQWLRSGADGPVEIVLHGMDGEVERWWRELGRPPRGPEGLRIELIRVERGAIAVITRARPGDRWDA